METKYGSEHPQVEKSERLQSYPNFFAFGFTLLVSNLPGILGFAGIFGIHTRKEFSGEGGRQKPLSKCLFRKGRVLLGCR